MVNCCCSIGGAGGVDDVGVVGGGGGAGGGGGWCGEGCTVQQRQKRLSHYRHDQDQPPPAQQLGYS